MKKLFLIAFIFGCNSIPPEPEPSPDKPIAITIRDDFNGSSVLFARGRNPGNVSSIANGQYNLSGDANGAAWIYTKAYGLDSLLAFCTKVNVSADFYIGMSTSLDSNSTHAIFPEQNRLLFYVYRKSEGTYAFHEKFNQAGMSPKEFDPITSITPAQQCFLSFTFKRDTVSMHYSADGQTYSEISKEVLSAAWDSVYFAISAWRTPLHGIASIDWAELEYWSKHDTTTPPAYRKATLQWNKNKEPDMLGYNVYIKSQSINEKFFVQDTVVDFQNLSTEQYKFFVTALDSARNESAPSDMVEFD